MSTETRIATSQTPENSTSATHPLRSPTDEVTRWRARVGDVVRVRLGGHTTRARLVSVALDCSTVCSRVHLTVETSAGALTVSPEMVDGS